MKPEVGALLEAGNDIVSLLREGSPTRDALQACMQRRGELLKELDWSRLTAEQVERVSVQDRSITEEALRLQASLLKALGRFLPHRSSSNSPSNRRYYGRFHDTRS